MKNTFKFTASGEKVQVTEETRDLGHGDQIKVIYSDGSLGWEHTEDLQRDGIKTYKVTGKTNGWIAQRDINFNGKTEINLAENLTLEEAREKLADFFYKDYDHYYDSVEISYNEETEESEYGVDERWNDYGDGTASYEYDSRYYRIEEEEN